MTSQHPSSPNTQSSNPAPSGPHKERYGNYGFHIHKSVRASLIKEIRKTSAHLKKSRFKGYYGCATHIVLDLPKLSPLNRNVEYEEESAERLLQIYAPLFRYGRIEEADPKHEYKYTFVTADWVSKGMKPETEAEAEIIAYYDDDNRGLSDARRQRELRRAWSAQVVKRDADYSANCSASGSSVVSAREQTSTSSRTISRSSESCLPSLPRADTSSSRYAPRQRATMNDHVPTQAQAADRTNRLDCSERSPSPSKFLISPPPAPIPTYNRSADPRLQRKVQTSLSMAAQTPTIPNDQRIDLPETTRGMECTVMGGPAAYPDSAQTHSTRESKEQFAIRGIDIDIRTGITANLDTPIPEAFDSTGKRPTRSTEIDSIAPTSTTDMRSRDAESNGVSLTPTVPDSRHDHSAPIAPDLRTQNNEHVIVPPAPLLRQAQMPKNAKETTLALVDPEAETTAMAALSISRTNTRSTLRSLRPAVAAPHPSERLAKSTQPKRKLRG